MSSSANAAAWLTGEKAYPLEVSEAPQWTPGDDEILVKARALAINPIDGDVQKKAVFQMKYPTVLGSDVAGEVVEMGSSVTRFKKGDRVLGQLPGIISGKPCEFGFQSFSIMKEHMATEVPEHISFEEACALPLGISTAACGLFQDYPFLGLDYPTEPAREPNGKTILIWGGASSVGSCGIQLSRAAGYEILTTASPKNFEYVKKLGASQVFDYNDSMVVNKIIEACKGKELVGALDCIGPPATTPCQQIVTEAGGKKIVATTKVPPKDTMDGVTVKHIFGVTLKDNAVGPAVYVDYLSSALKAGSFTPAPKPEIVGRGLENVQKGIDLYVEGISAKKLVVLL